MTSVLSEMTMENLLIATFCFTVSKSFIIAQNDEANVMCSVQKDNLGDDFMQVSRSLSTDLTLCTTIKAIKIIIVIILGKPWTLNKPWLI